MEGLIPAENAMIVYDYDPETRKTNRFKVFCRKDKNQMCEDYEGVYESYITKLLSRYEDYGFSFGCCCADWMEGSFQYREALLFESIFKHCIHDKELIKKAIFQCGKIKEMEVFRRLYHQLYLSYDMTFDGLMNSYYDGDFCDGH